MVSRRTELRCAVPLCAEPTIRSEFSVLNRRDGWWLTGDGPAETRLDDRTGIGTTARNFTGTFRSDLAGRVRSGDAKHFLGYKLGAFPGATGISTCGPPTRSPMVIAGARGAGAADCFRESGQPNAGAGELPRTGNGHAHGGGSDERPIDPTIAGGKPASWPGWRAPGRSARACVDSFACLFDRHAKRSSFYDLAMDCGCWDLPRGSPC